MVRQGGISIDCYLVGVIVLITKGALNWLSMWQLRSCNTCETVIFKDNYDWSIAFLIYYLGAPAVFTIE